MFIMVLIIRKSVYKQKVNEMFKISSTSRIAIMISIHQNSYAQLLIYIIQFKQYNLNMDFQRQENFATSLNPHIEVVQHIVPFSNFIESQPISISADSIIPSFTLHAQLFEAMEIHFQKQKPKQAIIFGNEFQKNKGILQFLNIIQQTEEEDISLKISTESCFCLNFSIIKGSFHNFIEKLKYQIRKCQQLPINTSIRLDSKFNIFEKVYYQLFRGFIAVNTIKDEFRAHKFIYYPNVNIQIKETKILPYKYVSNEVFDNIRSGNQNNHQYGYLTLDQRNRIVLINRDINIPITGVWIYSDLFKKKDSPELKNDAYHLIWAILTDYLIRNSISKYSVLKSNKSFLCIFSPNDKKPYLYTFQMTNSASAKWILNKSTSNLEENIIFDLKNSIDDLSQLFDTGKVVNNININTNNNNINPNTSMKMAKNGDQILKKQISSPAHQFMSKTVKSREYPIFANQTFAKSEADSKSLKDVSEDKNSQASYDEKDVKIKILTEQMEFYKAKYEELMQRFLPNPYQYPPQYHQYHNFQYGQEPYQKPYQMIPNAYQSVPPPTQSLSSPSYMPYNAYQPQLYNYHQPQMNTPPQMISQSYVKRSVEQQTSYINQSNNYQSKQTQQKQSATANKFQNISPMNKIKNNNNNEKLEIPYQNPSKKLETMFTEQKQKKEEEFDSPKFSIPTNNISKQSDSIEKISKVPNELSKNTQQYFQQDNIQNTQNYINIFKNHQQTNKYYENSYDSKALSVNKLDTSVESTSKFHPEYSFKDYHLKQQPQNTFAQSFASQPEQKSYRINSQYLKKSDLNIKTQQIEDSDCEEDFLKQIQLKYQTKISK